MSVLDARGMPVQKISEDQIVTALNTLNRRNQAQQMQIMQMGLLIEFLIEKLSTRKLPDGDPIFTVSEQEYEDFSRTRYEEIRVQAKDFAAKAQESGVQLDLQE